METFTAIPSIRRFPLTVVDVEKLDAWMASDDVDAPIPTITKIFVGYERGPGTPVPVQIEVDQLDAEHQGQIPTDEDRTNLSIAEYLNKWRRANMLLRRNLLQAVVRNLDVESANALAKDDDGPGFQLLVQLGWLEPKATDDDAESENKEEGEATAVDETGESTSLISQPSTKESTSRRTK